MAKLQSLSFLLLLTILLISHALSRPLNVENTLKKRHEDWMAQHGRVYLDAAEKEKRFAVFKENVEKIDAFNNGEEKGYKLGVNRFADLTNEEFRSLYTGLKYDKSSRLRSKPSSFRYENFTAAPTTMDWRKMGVVTPIKDQAQCGSCWAFSSVAAMEGAIKLKTGKLVSLSEQELIDCDVNGEDAGCNGGLMDEAFKFIKSNGGLTTESNYPYTGQDGTCSKTKAANSAATISGYEDVPENDEAALMQAVANQPVSVAVDGGGMYFQFYKSGVFSGDCDTYLDHAVTAVGYGTESDGTKYWLVKNSWGTSWGESGYMRLKKDVSDKEGLCGIAMMASYPVA